MSSIDAAEGGMDASLRDALVHRRGNYDYVIHPLLDGVPRCDPALVREFVAWAQEQPETRQANVILAPEAMGIPLAVGLSLATGIPYLVARKRKYGLPGEEVAFCETGYGEACIHLNDCKPGDQVLIVDDVVSTGGTLQGLLAALAGLRVEVVGVLVAVDKSAKAPGLEAKHGVPVRAWRRIRVEDGKVILGGHKPV